MKKNLFLTFAMQCILLIALPVFITSCSDDNSDEPEDPTPAKVEAVYEVKLSDTWYQYWDVTLTYTDEEGMQKTAILTENVKTTVAIPVAKAPASVVMGVKVTPKSDRPAVDNAKTYAIDTNFSFTVKTLDTDGNIYGDVYIESSGAKMTVSGQSLGTLLDKSETLFNDLYTLKLK